MIQFENVGLRYGVGPEILRDLSFHIAPRSFQFLSGPSGEIIMFPAGHDMRIIAAVTRVAGGRAVVHRTFGRQKHAATARRADAGAHIRNDAEVNERGDVVKRRRNAVNRRPK